MKTFIALLCIVAAVVVITVWRFDDKLSGTAVSPTVSPTATASDTSSPTAVPTLPITQGQIRVFSPQPNDEVGLPISIKGEARVFEGTFVYRIKDATGQTVLQRSAMTSGSAEAPTFDPFTVSANYPKPNTATGSLEVFEFSAKDGAEVNKVIIPIRFKTVDSQLVQVFYSSRTNDPNSQKCEVTYGVVRRIPKTSTPARAALEELLLGPTAGESSFGMETSINPFTKINSLVLKNGVMTADFDQTLQAGVAGSCRVQTIRSQITNTLKQFTSVKSVVISINGDSQGILQP